jgi:hypothetical protein
MNIFKANRLKKTLDKMKDNLELQYDCIEEAEEALGDIYENVDEAEEAFARVYAEYKAEGGAEDYSDYLVPEEPINDVVFEPQFDTTNELAV